MHIPTSVLELRLVSGQRGGKEIPPSGGVKRLLAWSFILTSLISSLPTKWKTWVRSLTRFGMPRRIDYTGKNFTNSQNCPEIK